MKLVLWLLIFVAAFALWFVTRSPRSAEPKKADPGVYAGLRNMVLHASRDKLPSIPKPSSPTEPWGAVMDRGVNAGTATVVALGDGTVSIYLSSGGGFLGGGQSHETIRNAGKQMLDAARQTHPLMRPTTNYPLPERGQVTFYVLTDSGVFTAIASETDLQNHSSPFSKLGVQLKT